MKRLIILLLLLCPAIAHADAEPNYERLADAIYKAEGGANTSHPYGILAHYRHTTARQACINTCKHRYQDWIQHGERGDYLHYLSTVYAPIGAGNDPDNLNRNWEINVRSLYRGKV